MPFGDILKEQRKKLGLSQKELAEEVGVTTRSIQNYESNNRHPKDVAILGKLAKALKTNITTLMCSQEFKTTDILITEIQALFAGGELGEEDKEAVFNAITDAYLDAKEKNKKYRKK
ncbi:MAG: helix-turn-helix transcriptional regulator [Firmicutes bacterium]|nr:helix-turn-helix transcriptional regulator [Bacillota bacterium]